MRIEPQQLIAFLIDGGIAEKKDLEAAQEESGKTGKKIEAILLEKKIISEDELIKLKAYILGVPFVNLDGEEVPQEVLKIIPEPIARRYSIVAFRKKGKDLEVAMIDPEDLQTIEFIKKKANLNILPRLTNPAGIASILKQYQKSIEQEFSDLFAIQSDKTISGEEGEVLEGKIISAPSEEGEGGQKVEDLAKAAEDLPVIRIVDSLIKHAITQSASDIHIEPTEKDVVVRYRIDGILHDAMVLPKQLQQGIMARIKVLSNLRLDEHRLPQDGRFKIESSELKISFRVSIIPVYDGEKVVMRILREEGHNNSLENLGVHGESLERVHRAIRKPSGMFLVTGPTGHGKSTTIAAVLDEINHTRETHIITIEDPIEFIFKSKKSIISQREMGVDTHSWQIALRSVLREDPDVVLVGEMRDYETIAAALTVAETGHLVFATLHTNSAAQTIDRIVDVFPDEQQEQVRLQLSNVIEAVFSMRLVPGTTGNRVVAYEMMLGSPAIKTAIRDGKTHQIDNILQTSQEIGMNTLEVSLASLIKSGKVNLETAQSYSLRPEELNRLIRSAR